MPIMIFMTRFYHKFKYCCGPFTVIKNKINILAVLVPAVIASFIVSCEEDPTRIGHGMLPSNEFVKIASTDTLSVWSYTEYDPKVRTDLPNVSYLGELQHPYYGTTRAEFVTELRLGGIWDDSKLYTVDSVKLYLRVLDIRGNSDTKHILRLTEIDKRLYTDSAYYSNTPVPVTDASFGNIEIPAPDSVVTTLAIDLPVELGNYLIRDTSKLFYSASGKDFREYFNGFYFQMESSADPMLLALSLAPPSTLGDNQNYIVLFMHDQAATKREFYFILDATNRNASFNKFTHDFSTADPVKGVKHVNDGYRDTLSYLQYLNGVYTTFVFPGLETMKNDPQFKNIVVNRAKLKVPVYYDGDLYTPTTIPEQLALRYVGKDGLKYIVPEYSYDTFHNFFGGAKDTIRNVYEFNIPGYLQNYFDDATGTLLPRLEVFQISGLRNAIFKTDLSSKPVEFEFTYTRF